MLALIISITGFLMWFRDQSMLTPPKGARYSAVLGICGLVLLPFIHLSVYLFRTLHPQPIVLKPSAPSAPPEMVVTLLSSFAVFTILYVGFVMQRYAIGERTDDA